MQMTKNTDRMSGRLTVALLFGVLLAGMAAPPSAAADPHFVIAASAQSPPYSYLDNKNNPQGILIDFWNLWARKTGAEVSFALTSFDKAIKLVRDGKADFHAGIFYSEPRARHLDFSTGFLDDTLSLFVLDKLDVYSTSDLKNVPVVVGISKEYYAVEYMKEHYPFIGIRLYNNNEELLYAALRREIVAFVVDYPVAFHYLSKNDSLGRYRVIQDISSQKLRAAVKKSNRETLDFINNGLKKISDRELSDLSDKWGLRQSSVIPPWFKKVLLGGGVVVILLAFFIHWALLRKEIRKQTSDLAEKNKILTLMQRDMMEVSRTTQNLMEDLEKISRDNEQLLDMIAREMKEPLESIQRATEDGDCTGPTLMEIHDQSEKVLSLIEKFRQVSPVDAENYSQEMKKINLTEFFSKKKKDFKNLSLLKGIDLHMDMPAKTVTAMIHPGHFDELCNNIFLSTVKYSRAGGQIRISLALAGTSDEKKIVIQFGYHSLAGGETRADGSSGASDRELPPVESASGIRLALIKKLILLQGGKISAFEQERGERTIRLELPAVEEIVKSYEDIEALVHTGDIILFKGLYYNRHGEKSVATDWTHVGLIVRLPGNPLPLIWESTPLENVPDKELGKGKSGAQLVSLKERLENYETNVYAIRFLKVIRDPSMLNHLFRFISYAHALPFPGELRLIGRVIHAKIFTRLYRMKRRYKNIFCSELVAESYMVMGLLPEDPPPSAYMPVDFSTQKKLPLLKGAHLSGEFMISIEK